MIFLDVQKAYDKAWLDGIWHALHRNGVMGKNLTMIKKLNSNLRARIHTRHGLTREIKNQRQHQTRRSPIASRKCNPNRPNSQKTKNNDIGLQTKQGTQLATEHPTMDGWRMPRSPWPDNPTGNDGHHKPRRKKVPYRIWGSKMQGSENRIRPS